MKIFDKTFAINVKAMILLTQLMTDGMVKRGVASGAVVNVSSQSSTGV